MPSLHSTALFFLSSLLATTTLAAPAAVVNVGRTTPITNTTPNPSPLLTKRLTYYSNNDNDYCGEANPTYYTDSSAPLASDCKALVAANPGPGYWEITTADTSAAPSGWVRLAASGTCAFEVQWDSAQPLASQDYRFGTNDLQFYVNSYALENVGADGRVGVNPQSVQCYTGVNLVDVHFRVVHS